jgi:N6-L-threonylcarbamoyladenine synthase
MEGHALVPRLNDPTLVFPYVALLISGGHTQILVCHGVGEYAMLGETLDDAVGDAYDRTAALLLRPNTKTADEVEYHQYYDGGGGKALERLARQGRVVYDFPVPLRTVKNCDFSFSGLKTAVRTTVTQLLAERKTSRDTLGLPIQDQADIAASFQHAVATHLEDRLQRAFQWCRVNAPTVQHLVLSGGVACNGYLRERLAGFAMSHGFQLKAPPPHLCTDNGIMIAWAGIENWRYVRCLSVVHTCRGGCTN